VFVPDYFNAETMTIVDLGSYWSRVFRKFLRLSSYALGADRPTPTAQSAILTSLRFQLIWGICFFAQS
jgi:hypothetical protein